jgi:hypothetical protein
MTLNPDRLVCGVATIFDEPSRNDGRAWSVDDFAAFLGLETAIPLLLDHGPIVHTWGITDRLGMVRGFFPIVSPVRGLLTMAEVDYAGGAGDSVLTDIRSILSQRWLPAAWGMSVGAWVEEGTVVPYEVSLTRKPAFESARVLAAGPQALDTWELLTGSPYDTAAHSKPWTADRW